MTSKLDAIRAATIGAKKQFKTKICKIGGEEVELRQPSLKLRQMIFNKSKVDGEVDLFEFTLYGVIFSAFIPGTQDRVFTEADYDTLKEMPTGDWMDELGAAVVELMNVDADTEKNSKGSGTTQSAKPSVK